MPWFFIDKTLQKHYIVQKHNMKVSIIGTGYVGLVNGVCMAYKGAEVTCIDVDEEKIELLKSGKTPIFEELLEDMMKYCIDNGRLKFSTDYSSVNDSNLTFICVGTPEGEYGSADLTHVLAAANEYAKNIDHESTLVVKSTVPVGTTYKVKNIVDAIVGGRFKMHYAFNPEFLKEGVAVKDCLNPDRVVLGLEDKDDMTSVEYKTLKTLYGKVENLVVTDIISAEMVKYASNAMLATRISFINEIAKLCECVGADIEDVAKCVGLDSRIGPKFLKAGCGYGGSCFPKDVRALMKTAEDHEVNMFIMNAVDSVNELQKDILYEKYTEYYTDGPAKKACVFGLAFKPGTDDMREAPSIYLINALLNEGVEVTACDPIAIDNAKKIFGDKIKYEKDPYRAAKDSDVVFLVTEWEEFKKLNMKKVYEGMTSGHVLIDGRNVYNRKSMEALGFQYDRIG